MTTHSHSLACLVTVSIRSVDSVLLEIFANLQKYRLVIADFSHHKVKAKGMEMPHC